MARFEDSLRERERHMERGVWVTNPERDAIVDALTAARDYAQFLSPVSVGPMSASRARLTYALAQLDAGVSE
jgi:hypothetical protein